MIRCAICTASISEGRQARRGFSSVTCSDECYQELRRARKRPKGQRVTPQEWRYVMQIRRAKAQGSDTVTLALSESLGSAQHEPINALKGQKA